MPAIYTLSRQKCLMPCANVGLGSHDVVPASAASARAQASTADMPSVTLPADFATACASAAAGVCPPNGDGVQVTIAYFADPSLLVQATPRKSWG